MRFGKLTDGVLESLMSALERCFCICPGCFTRVACRRPILRRRDFDRCAIPGQTATANLLPHTDVPDQFPDAMDVGEWPRCRLLGGDSGKHFAHRRPMPGIAFVSAL